MVKFLQRVSYSMLQLAVDLILRNHYQLQLGRAYLNNFHLILDQLVIK